jgi:hypothetical protein
MPTTDIDRVCNWYKAKPGRVFRLGCAEYWAHHEDVYMSEEDRYRRNSAQRSEPAPSTKGMVITKSAR